MRIFLAFFAYFVGCMLISALVLPWLQPWFALWFDAPPDRSLYRLGMLLTALGLPFLLASLRIRDRLTMGWLPQPRGARRGLFTGVLLGSLMLLTVVLALGGFGVRQLKADELDLTRILSAALSGLASGLVVGLIEEFFFRGPMQGGMRRTLNFWYAAILTAAFYSIVHFARPTPLEGTVLDISSSLMMLWGGLQQLLVFGEYADSFVTLVFGGIILSMTRERTGSIFLAIGIHAGWVMIIRITKAITDTDLNSPWIWLIGDYNNITGWLASTLIALSAILYWHRTRARSIQGV